VKETLEKVPSESVTAAGIERRKAGFGVPMFVVMTCMQRLESVYSSRCQKMPENPILAGSAEVWGMTVEMAQILGDPAKV